MTPELTLIYMEWEFWKIRYFYCVQTDRDVSFIQEAEAHMNAWTNKFRNEMEKGKPNESTRSY